jgi:glycosyltransferase involved in cell wall biosynthesis
MSTIVHLITTIEMGGAEKQLLVLAGQQASNGHDVTVLYLKGKPELKQDFESLGVKVSSRLTHASSIVSCFRFSRFLEKNPNAVCHAHLPQSELIAAFATGKKKKLVVTRHNAEQFWPRRNRYVSKVLSRLVAARADRVIAISQAVADFLYQSGEISTHTNVEVVLYGSAPNSESTAQAFFPETSRGETRIGTIGRLVDQKNYPTLLNAFSLVVRENPTFHLYVIGDGPLKKKLLRLADELEIGSAVTWLGRTDKIPQFLSSIDLFVLSSKYEGFGLVLLEAMAAGTPILAANNSAIPEVLGENYPGLFGTYDSDELAKKILEFPKFKNEYEESLNKRLVLFHPHVMYQKIQEIYQLI